MTEIEGFICSGLLRAAPQTTCLRIINSSNTGFTTNIVINMLEKERERKEREGEREERERGRERGERESRERERV